MEDQYLGALRGEMYAGDMLVFFLSPLPVHLQNNLPTISPDLHIQYVLMNLLLKKTAAELLRLHPANESYTMQRFPASLP